MNWELWTNLNMVPLAAKCKGCGQAIYPRPNDGNLQRAGMPLGLGQEIARRVPGSRHCAKSCQTD